MRGLTSSFFQSHSPLLCGVVRICKQLWPQTFNRTLDVLERRAEQSKTGRKSREENRISFDWIYRNIYKFIKNSQITKKRAEHWEKNEQ